MTRRIIRIIDSNPRLESALGWALFGVAVLITLFLADAVGWYAVVPALGFAFSAVALWDRASTYDQRRLTRFAALRKLEKDIDD